MADILDALKGGAVAASAKFGQAAQAVSNAGNTGPGRAVKNLALLGLGTAAAAGISSEARASAAEIYEARSLTSTTRGSSLPTASRNAMYRLWVVNNYSPESKAKATIVKAWIPEQISLDVSATYSALFGSGFLSDDNAFNLAARSTGFTGLTQEMSYKIWTSSQGITMTIPVIFTMDDTQLESDGTLATGSRGVGFSDYDIMTSILELQKLCLPSKVSESWFLEPPGSVLRSSSLLSATYATLRTTAVELTNDALGTTAGTALSSLLPEASTSKADQGAQSVQGPNSDASPSEFTTKKLVDSWTSVYIGDFLYFDMVVMENVGAAYDMQLNERGKPIRATVNITFSTLFDATIQDLNSIYLVNPQTDPNSKSNPDAKS